MYAIRSYYAYELETYVANMLLWYPDGLKISFDYNSIKAGNIIEHGNDIYTVDLMVNKTNNGNYLNRQTNNVSKELLYRIAFLQKGSAYESFKIAGVRSNRITSYNVCYTKLLRTHRFRGR